MKKKGFQPLLLNEQKLLLENYQNINIVHVFGKYNGKMEHTALSGEREFTYFGRICISK